MNEYCLNIVSLSKYSRSPVQICVIVIIINNCYCPELLFNPFNVILRSVKLIRFQIRLHIMTYVHGYLLRHVFIKICTRI